MSRSVKKGPFISERLIGRIQAMNASGKKTVVKTWSRASTIYPDMVGHTIAVHDGRKQGLREVLFCKVRRNEANGNQNERKVGQA